ncbi:MAG: LysR family transcriptional regulator [Sneathiellales bacterium]|nr:LysR family transcriptional regulator [Sneathiellales bacterium]
MKYDQLVALEAIVSTGTFRGASDRLNKAQSAVSNAIRLLEEDLDFKIFNRQAYRPTLTPEGEIFYSEALAVLRQMRELKKTASRLRAHEEAELRLALSITFPLHSALDALKDIGNQYPATRLHVATEAMGGPIARLMEGKADIAIASLDGVDLNKVDTKPVGEITIRTMASPEFAARLGTGTLSQAALRGHAQIIVTGTGGSQYNQSRDLLEGGKKWTVSDFAAKKDVILAGLGWGGLPDHLTADERKKGMLVPITIEGFAPRHTTLYAIRNREADFGVVAHALWDRLGK